MDINRKPIKINITIASAIAAIEYWLNHTIFQNEVKINKINFTEKDHFTIYFDRQEED